MIRGPDVVVTDIGDPGPACGADARVVRKALTSGIQRQVEPGDAFGGEGPDGGFGFVGTSVADHDQFEMCVGLAEHLRDGRRDVPYAPVGRKPDGEEWTITHQN